MSGAAEEHCPLTACGSGPCQPCKAGAAGSAGVLGVGDATLFVCCTLSCNLYVVLLCTAQVVKLSLLESLADLLGLEPAAAARQLLSTTPEERAQLRRQLADADAQQQLGGGEGADSGDGSSDGAGRANGYGTGMAAEAEEAD